LKEDLRLTELGNGVLMRILWPKRDAVTEEWRILHNKELYDLYSLPNIFIFFR
jgi:hypothetical protein